eukprot:COSAG03_NODE_32970_length_137_cov_23.763158_1_plen_30_part_01
MVSSTGGPSALSAATGGGALACVEGCCHSW